MFSPRVDQFFFFRARLRFLPATHALRQANNPEAEGPATFEVDVS